MSNKPKFAPVWTGEAPTVASLRVGESKHPPTDGPGRAAAADVDFFQIVHNLPVAVYSTDATGRITFYNDAAATLWGRRPILGEDWRCGSWRLYWPDGTPMGHDECPMAVTLKTGCAVRGRKPSLSDPTAPAILFLLTHASARRQRTPRRRSQLAG